MSKEGLIIFVKNPVLGKVKTRLAKDIGDEAALKVYQWLLKHTRLVASEVDCDKHVFYDTRIERDDDWNNEVFDKHLQIVDKNLGARMMAAFVTAFQQGYNKVVIIGSDCPDLQQGILKDAFKSLDEQDMVIGPAKDGGYYLLGMKVLHPEVFQHNKWSTKFVLEYTVNTAKGLGLSCEILQELSDIDRQEDLKRYQDDNQEVNFLNY